ncbi:MAG: glycosyltransferase family 2 protein [Pyrinomonadaceae bacterium]|nr:glycosyltransferase family 2 protein [Pyrinomonadaceae bacterium]
MTKVSIIIATHNRPHLLPNAVESARKAGQDVEILVVDDGSGEETAAVCRGLSGIRYLRIDHNQGLGAARNVGILASSGEFITFLDDDDLRLPGSLDAQVAALASTPAAGLVYGQTLLGDQNCIPTGYVYPTPCPQGDVFWELLERNFISCPSAVFRRSCLDRIGLPTTTLPGIEDWDLWIRIAELYPVVAVERPVAIYRRATPDSNQFTSNAAAMSRLIAMAHRQRWLALPRARSAPAAQRRAARRGFSLNMANHLIWETGRGLKHGRYLAAQRNLLTALSLHPLAVAHRVTRPANLRFLYSRSVGKWLRAGQRQNSYNIHRSVHRENEGGS